MTKFVFQYLSDDIREGARIETLLLHDEDIEYIRQVLGVTAGEPGS